MSTTQCQCGGVTTDPRITEILSKYPSKESANLIPMLQEVQEKYGYLPRKALVAAAKHTGLSTAEVYGVATFYNQFRFKPLGKYTISVCCGTACHVRGAAEILQTLESELDIHPGETTEDGLFTLETVACLGACSMAPVVMVNGEFHGKLTPKSVLKMLNLYRKKG
ncbi:MAG: NADH-quinone oxidoreductase subunit NuoE [Limnochordia bacterium]